MDNAKRLLFYQRNLSKMMADFPDFLYRYRPGNSLNTETKELYDIEALLNDKIWLSRADQFNDPFDSLYRINGELMNNQDITFAASFAESYKDICMWSHYANYHKGFCLEYKFSDAKCLPIYYSKEIDIDIPCMQSTFIKSLIWENELEWRYADQSILAIENRYKAGYLIDYIRPTSIYLGYNYHRVPELTEKLKHVAVTKGINLYYMDYSLEKNKLFRKEFL